MFIDSLFTKAEIEAFDPTLTFSFASRITSKPATIFKSDRGAHVWQSLISSMDQQNTSSKADPGTEPCSDILKLFHKSCDCRTVQLTLLDMNKCPPDIISLISTLLPESLLLSIDSQEAILVISPRMPVAFTNSLSIIESTDLSIDIDQIPERVIASAVRQTFAEFLASSGEWFPVNSCTCDKNQREISLNDIGSNAFLWRPTLPRMSEDDEQGKILGIKLSGIRKVGDHFELSFSFRSYAHKVKAYSEKGDGGLPPVTCLPNLSCAFSLTPGPYPFQPTKAFPTWDCLRGYWQEKYHYTLNDSKNLCIDIRFATNSATTFTYPADCVLPGIVKFGAMTSYVDRPVCLPLIKTALKNLILTKPNAWRTALITARHALPPPISTLSNRRIPAAHYQAIVEATEAIPVPTEDEEIFADDEWCRDLNELNDIAEGLDTLEDREVHASIKQPLAPPTCAYDTAPAALVSASAAPPPPTTQISVSSDLPEFMIESAIKNPVDLSGLPKPPKIPRESLKVLKAPKKLQVKPKKASTKKQKGAIESGSAAAELGPVEIIRSEEPNLAKTEPPAPNAGPDQVVGKNSLDVEDQKLGKRSRSSVKRAKDEGVKREKK